ncbi:acyl-CoA thioesterase [Geobacter hydrogenophilus]|uniref:Thioesterase domain-containing protein n=1 Tax=Geobacter hydrogenophilus TaxID=40983 RepID=A0A9W6G1S7_9BACT|nr:hotdog domain-containing protein [Geobacter hydrogenophilus]MBT0895599.1 acyl-CoA thioesterase [Geobacter hydrogenophilus]GLI39290.1 hypothetical protein GHYDROH2_27910 [Geobacter hydrogenophilus]
MSGTLFTYRRKVDFGDCDSARIYFTPRAVDYAVEAVEAWYGDVLGVSWPDLLQGHDLDVTFVRMGCEYFRPVIADQTVYVRVRATAVDRSSVTFSAAGEDDSGGVFFRATLVAQFSAGRNRAPVPIPPRYRERIEACLEQADGEPGTVAQRICGEPFPSRVQSDGVPFTVRRRVAYGDCTLSGTVYAPRLLNYAVEAAGEWYRETLGISWREQCILQRGAPFREVWCERLAPLVPGQVITMAVGIPRLGKSSIGYEVAGYDDRGEPCFHAEMSACYISEETGSFKVIPFPDDMRSRILAYQALCDQSIIPATAS